MVSLVGVFFHVGVGPKICSPPSTSPCRTRGFRQNVAAGGALCKWWVNILGCGGGVLVYTALFLPLAWNDVCVSDAVVLLPRKNSISHLWCLSSPPASSHGGSILRPRNLGVRMHRMMSMSHNCSGESSSSANIPEDGRSYNSSGSSGRVPDSRQASLEAWIQRLGPDTEPFQDAKEGRMYASPDENAHLLAEFQPPSSEQPSSSLSTGRSACKEKPRFEARRTVRRFVPSNDTEETYASECISFGGGDMVYPAGLLPRNRMRQE